MADDFIPREYLKKIQRYSRLSRKEQFRLGKIKDESSSIARRENAKLRLFNSELNAVVAVSKMYRERGIDIMDLIQEGNLGLRRGVEDWDYTTGNRLMTYARWWIHQRIKKTFYEDSRTIRIPTWYQKKVGGKNGRGLLDGEIPKARNYEDMGIFDSVKGESQNPLEELTKKDLREYVIAGVGNFLNLLGEREKYVLEARFGIGSSGDQTFTLKEIGKDLGVTSERVRQIQEKSLKKLRGFVKGTELELLAS